MTKTEERMQWCCQQRNRNCLVFAYHLVSKIERDCLSVGNDQVSQREAKNSLEIKNRSWLVWNSHFLLCRGVLLQRGVLDYWKVNGN